MTRRICFSLFFQVTGEVEILKSVNECAVALIINGGSGSQRRFEKHMAPSGTMFHRLCAAWNRHFLHVQRATRTGPHQHEKVSMPSLLGWKPSPALLGPQGSTRHSAVRPSLPSHSRLQIGNWTHQSRWHHHDPAPCASNTPKSGLQVRCLHAKCWKRTTFPFVWFAGSGRWLATRGP